MKSTKKLMAVILSLVMAFTMVSTSLAADADVTEPTTEKVEINIESSVAELTSFATILHDVIGDILALFEKECPLCKKLHVAEQAPEDTEEDTTDVVLPTEPSTEETTTEEPTTEAPTTEEPATGDAEDTEESTTKFDVADAIETGKSFYNTIHSLVGGIMGMLEKTCPFCDELHAIAEEEATTEPVTEVTLPTEPVAA